MHAVVVYHSASKCCFVNRCITGTNFLRVSGFINSTIRLRCALAFSSDVPTELQSLVMALGHQETITLFSLENKNLFPAGPQKTATFSPPKEVLKTTGECFFILSVKNFSGKPFWKSNVSPTIGNPTLPGGSVLCFRPVGL